MLVRLSGGLLEPCAVRVARRVLRVGGGGDVTALPDTNWSRQLEGLAGWQCSSTSISRS
ncbi:MAG: hypothetical protein ACFB2W_25840 [Leptolyngbyaceae cyanobacterium]